MTSHATLPTDRTLPRASSADRAMALGGLLIGGKLEQKLLDRVVRKQGDLISTWVRRSARPAGSPADRRPQNHRQHPGLRPIFNC